MARLTTSGAGEAADIGVRIEIVRAAVNNVFLVRERGAVLIDTGPRRLGRSVLRRLRRLLDDLHDIRVLVATHGHFDDIGAAARSGPARRLEVK